MADARGGARGGGRWGKNISLADTGGAATIPSTPFSSQCRKVRVGGDKAYWVRIGDPTQTAVHGDALIGAGQSDYFDVVPGQHLAAISTSTTSGFISIVEIY